MLSYRVITPQGKYAEGVADSIHTASVEGELTLLQNHMPCVLVLKTSRLEIKKDNQTEVFAIGGGIATFMHNRMIILVDVIEGREEIDVERARRAKERAEENLRNAKQSFELKQAEIALRKAINRINVSK